MAAYPDTLANPCFFTDPETEDPMTDEEACHNALGKWCDGPWTLRTGREDDRFGWARDWWFVFRRDPRPLPSNLIRFWHGTSLDVATRILSQGFLVSASTENKKQGMFGICSKSHNDDHFIQDCCRRLALDRAKTDLSAHWQNGGPTDSWAAPVAMCFLLPAGQIHTLKDYPHVKRGRVIKALVRGKEGEVKHFTIRAYAEVHIPHREYMYTFVWPNVADAVKAGDRVKCVHCQNTRPKEEKHHWQRKETLECGPCNYWAHHMER